jgi:K+-transporting ATPase ATPase C chain
MFREIMSQMKTALMMLILLTVLTGMLYPFIVTLFAQLLFPWQANGSLIERNGEVIGSHLIGQAFTSPHYFWGRPSATTPYPYNGTASSGSNAGPSNPLFLKTIEERAIALRVGNDQPNRLIPVDLVTASGSGLDPEISPFAAYFQVPRIARARDIPQEKILSLIHKHIQYSALPALNVERINVLQLNLDLDDLKW